MNRVIREGGEHQVHQEVIKRKVVVSDRYQLNPFQTPGRYAFGGSCYRA